MASTREYKFIITGTVPKGGLKRHGWFVRYVKRANRWVRLG